MRCNCLTTLKLRIYHFEKAPCSTAFCPQIAKRTDCLTHDITVFKPLRYLNRTVKRLLYNQEKRYHFQIPHPRKLRTIPHAIIFKGILCSLS